MPTHRPPLSALRAFEAAARRQSFRLAAEELAVTPTAISHQIRALEEELNCRLFERKVRAIALTADGRALYASIREGFELISAGVERFRRRAMITALLLRQTPSKGDVRRFDLHNNLLRLLRRESHAKKQQTPGNEWEAMSHSKHEFRTARSQDSGCF